jgi:uncharacterized protein YneF (UPF0154 family)
MTILIAILISTINLLCFYFGFWIGQKTTNNEVFKLPNVNPVRIINAINESKEESKEQERMRIIAENIDNYDGTGLNQRDIPR